VTNVPVAKGELGTKDTSISWLLRSKDPSVRYFTLTDVLGKSAQSSQVVAAKREIPQGPRLRVLLSGQLPDGGFGVHWYKKWSGAHWRLVSAVDLGVSQGNGAAVKAANIVLDHLKGMARRKPGCGGLYRQHASIPGNAVGASSRIGLAEDPRVEELALTLVKWQWPDGGWNCDPSKDAEHSSFYESLSTLWGLNEYLRATGNSEVRGAVERASEFFLKHRLFKSCEGDHVINPVWLKLHYPLYWHYDILQALRVVSLTDRLDDPRTSEALDILESKKMADGRWRPEGYYWRMGVGPGSEIVDWGRGEPNEMITLNALRVLVRSGRTRPSSLRRSS
jgi:hypothetical protein